jgi:serine/threonine protein kinase
MNRESSFRIESPSGLDGRTPNARRPVRLFGREYPVIGQKQVRRRTYLLLERLSSHRKRYLAFDTFGGPKGRAVALMVLPRSPSSRQHLGVLQRVSESSGSFATILDYESTREHSLVVLQWIRGPSLRRYLSDMKSGATPRISPVVAFQRIRMLAHALRMFHNRQQLVHGDIKPENLIVAPDSGRLVLIDFGSGWAVEHACRRDPGDGISPAYAAPELQCGAASPDFRADIFSVSAILYELLTIQLPYDNLGGKAGRPALVKQMRRFLDRPSQHSPFREQLPSVIWQGIDRVVMRGLALDPEERYPTPEAWLNELDAVDLDIKRPQTLSPLNAHLTRLVAWVAATFQRVRT